LPPRGSSCSLHVIAPIISLISDSGRTSRPVRIVNQCRTRGPFQICPQAVRLLFHSVTTPRPTIAVSASSASPSNSVSLWEGRSVSRNPSSPHDLDNIRVDRDRSPSVSVAVLARREVRRQHICLDSSSYGRLSRASGGRSPRSTPRALRPSRSFHTSVAGQQERDELGTAFHPGPPFF